MAEKINIFELDIDVDAAIKANAALAKSIDDQKAKLIELEYTVGKTDEAYIEQQATLKATQKEYNSAQNQIGKMIQLQGKEIKTVEQGRNALSILNKEWANQASLYGANSKEADALAKKTLEVRNRLKELEKGVGDNTRNVGNYSESFKEAIGQTTLFGRVQTGLNSVLKVAKPIYTSVKAELSGIVTGYKEGMAASRAFSGAQKASAISTTLVNSALKVFKVALVSTGIGAVLVLLGSLVAWFSKTQAGVDLVNKVLAGFSAGIDVVIDRLSKLGGAFGKLLSGDFSGAFDDMKDAASGFGDELQREITLAIKLEEVLQGVEKAEVNLDIRRSAANARLKELNKTIEDVNRSEEERIAAAQEYQKIESELVDEEVSNQEKRVAAMLGFAEVTDEVRDKIKQIGQEGVSLDELGLSESTIEDAKEFRDEIGKLFDLQTRSYEVQTTNQNKLNTIVNQVRAAEVAAAKEAQANAQKAIDAAIKENKTRLALYIEQNKAEAATLEAGISKAEEIRDRRLAILQQEVEAGKKTQTEAELERLQIKNDFLEEQKNLVVQFAQEELEIYISNHQSRIDANQLLNDQLVEQEIDRLSKVAEAERQFQQTRLEQGEISQREYNEAIAAIDEEARLAKEELQLELEEQKKEQAAIDLENERIANEERLAYDREFALAQYELGYQQRLEAAKIAGADLTKFEAAEAKKRQAIEIAVQQSKAQIASETFSNLSVLAGKETAAGKAFAIAQTTIDTYKSAQAAFSAMAGIPIVGPVLGGIAAGAAVAAGVINIQKITSTQVPKAEKGALFDIGGKRHSAGGTKFYGEDGTIFEAEQGELIGVLNRNAAQAFHGLNSMFPAGGGTGVNYFATGGMVQRAVSSGVQGGSVQVPGVEFDYDRLAQSNVQAFEGVSIVTDVKDVISEVGKRNTLVDGANF